MYNFSYRDVGNNWISFGGFIHFIDLQCFLYSRVSTVFAETCGHRYVSILCAFFILKGKYSVFSKSAPSPVPYLELFFAKGYVTYTVCYGDIYI